MCELGWIAGRVWITAAVFADKIAPSNGCCCSETGNSGRDPQNLGAFLSRAKSGVRGSPHECVGVCVYSSDVWWLLLPEALLATAVRLELPATRH